MDKGRADRVLGPLIVLLLVAPAAPSLAAAADGAEDPATLVVAFRGEVPGHVDQLVSRHGGELLEVLERVQAARVQADDPAAFADAMADLPSVLAVEPEATATAQALLELYTLQLCCSSSDGSYYYYSYDAETTAEEDGSPQTTVAIVDSGIDASHPNLTDNLWVHPETGTSGFDFVENDSVPDDEFGHGTHVAGLVQGVAPSTSIMSLKVMGPNGTGTVSDVAEAIQFAADQSADVILLSLGWSRLPSYPTTLIEDALVSAHAEGANVVAAAGNGGGVHTPASLPGVTAVTALNAEEGDDGGMTFSPASWASHGPGVDLAAAGNGINSTISNNTTLNWCGDNATFCPMSGSSVAAAPVAGAMAFIRSCRPTLNEVQIDELLYRTADDITGGIADLGWDEATGWGNLNLSAAVHHLVGCREPNSTASSDDGVGQVIWDSDEAELVAQDGWTRSTDRAFSQDGTSWHIDISNTTPERNVLETPTVYVPDSGTTQLSFARWEDTEPSSNHTLRQVRITTDGGATWGSIYKSVGEAPETWVVDQIDLPSWAQGEPVRAQFVFEPNETRLSTHEGWYVDDVKFQTTGSHMPPVERTYESGTLDAGNCTSFAVHANETGDFQPGDTRALDVELTEGTATADVRVVSPTGNRTGSWTCGDHGVRNEIPSSAYSGADAEVEWVRVAPVNATGNWTVTVRGVNGTTDWSVTVTEHLIPDDPPQTLSYGVDAFLDTVDETYPAMNCTGDSSGCSYDSSTDFSVWADANATGEHQAEVGSGYAYRLAEVCQAQTGDGLVTLHPDGTAKFHHESTDTGQYEASLRVRPAGLDGDPVVYDGEASGDLLQDDPPAYDPVFGTSYEHVVSAYAWAKTSLSLEDAYAKTAVELSGLDVVFGDDTAPLLDVATASEDPEAAEAGSGFLGWFQEPVTVSIEAWDPSGGSSSARSCVDRVTVDHLENDAPPTEVVAPGYYQPGSPSGIQADPYNLSYDGDKVYDLVIETWDANGTHANDTVSVSFGVDERAPTSASALDPPEPTGEDGWYKRNDSHANEGRPTLTVACSDPGEASSGCDTTQVLIDGELHAYSASYWADPGHVVSNGNHTVSQNSTDHADNVGATEGPFNVKVDVELPAVQLTPNATSGPSPDWYDQPLNVTATCVEEVSGCAVARATVDGTTYSMTTFQITDAGEHVVEWNAEDVASNVDNGSRAFHIDTQDPNGTSVTSPSDGFLTNATDLTVEWEAGTDNGPAGVSHHQVFLDGTFYANVSGTSTTISSISEGTHCVTVRVVDKAGNTGPNATEHCGAVDRTPPSISFDVPEDHHLLNGTGASIWVPNVDYGQAWVIPRNLSFETSATDNGEAGLASITIENGTSDPSPVTCSQSPCTRDFQNDLTDKWQEYPITVTAEDAVDNARSRDISVYHTVLHAYSDYDGDWHVVVDYRPYDGSGFQEYRILRDTDSGVDLDTETIATITGQDEARYLDYDVNEKTWYYYWIEYETTDWAYRTYSWTVKTGGSSGSGGGGGGGGGGCSLLGCMYLK